MTRSVRPRSRLTSISRPARNSRNASPIKRQNLNRRVDLDPAESGRADQDPEQDLEHDRRQPQARHETERERRHKRRHHDDQQVGEVNLAHRCDLSVNRAGHSLQRPTCNALGARWTTPVPRTSTARFQPRRAFRCPSQ